MLGVSTQAQTRGGADVAVGDSALSQVENPATLTLSPANVKAFDFSGQLIFPQVHWTGPVDSDMSDVKLLPLVNLGFSDKLNDKFAYGIAFQSKSGLGTEFDLRHALIPFWRRREVSDLKDLSLSLNAAYKLTEKLSLGAGLRAELATAEFSTVLGPADVEFGRGYSFGGGFQVGLHYQALDNLAFGLAYRSPTWFGDLSGGDADASLLGFLPVHLGTGSLNRPVLPQRVAAGWAWDVNDRLKLVGESRWLNYSNSSMHSVNVDIDGPLDFRLPLPLGYRDQWIFIAGAEYKLDQHWTASAGYNFGTNPSSRTSLLPITSIITQHHITLGLRYELDRWWVGGGYILALPNSLSANGCTKIPLGIDYTAGRLEHIHHSLLFGFGFCWQ